MTVTEDQLHALLIVFVASVAVIDWRTHRIPNVLCAVAAMFGVSLQIGLHGEAGLLSALGGAAVGFAMFLPFYVLRAFGAGDVKAMATVGIFLGFPLTVTAVASTLIAGGVLGVLVMLLRPANAGATLHRLAGLLLSPSTAIRNARTDRSLASSDRFPYGIAIACGTAVAVFVFSH